MLIIEMAKIELTGGHIGFMLIIEIAKIELTAGHIEFMLIIEITKIKLIGGHIDYAHYRDGLNKLLAAKLALC